MAGRKKIIFSQEIWPWELLSTDPDAQLVRRNRILCVVSPREPPSRADRDEGSSSSERALVKECRILASLSSQELGKALALIREVKRNFPDIDAVDQEFVTQVDLQAKIVDLVSRHPIGVRRGQLRRLLGGRFTGAGVDAALARLVTHRILFRDEATRRYRSMDKLQKEKSL